MNANLFWFFLIGALFANGMPHFTWGISGVIAKSPFAQKSKPIVNIRWGFANISVATLLLIWLGYSNTLYLTDVLAFLIGFWLVIAMFFFGIKRFIEKK